MSNIQTELFVSAQPQTVVQEKASTTNQDQVHLEFDSGEELYPDSSSGVDLQGSETEKKSKDVKEKKRSGPDRKKKPHIICLTNSSSRLPGEKKDERPKNYSPNSRSDTEKPYKKFTPKQGRNTNTHSRSLDLEMDELDRRQKALNEKDKRQKEWNSDLNQREKDANEMVDRIRRDRKTLDNAWRQLDDEKNEFRKTKSEFAEWAAYIQTLYGMQTTSEQAGNMLVPSRDGRSISHKPSNLSLASSRDRRDRRS